MSGTYPCITSSLIGANASIAPALRGVDDVIHGGGDPLLDTSWSETGLLGFLMRIFA